MPVTPGSSKRLNELTGIASSLVMTAAQEAKADVMARVIKTPGVLIRWSDKTASLTDGTSTLAQLKDAPQIDQRLLTREKDALMKTFSGADGAYQATEGGFLVLSTDGRMTSDHLPADVWDKENGKVLLSALPDTVRAGITFVADMAALEAIKPTDEAVRGFVMVMDASADPTVNAGSAVYCYVDDPANPGSKMWFKFQELESIDLDLDELGVSSANVEAAGAVMYDHMVELKAPAIEDYFAKVDYVPTWSLSSKILPDAMDHSKAKSVKLTINEYSGTGEGIVLTQGADTYTVGANGVVTPSAGAGATVTYANGVLVFTPATPAASYNFSVQIPGLKEGDAAVTVTAENVAFSVA